MVKETKVSLLRPTDETSAFVQFGELSYYTAYAHAVALRKVQLEEHEDDWRAILKGRRKGEYVVTFLSAPTFTRLVLLIGQLSDKDGLTWYPDKYP